MRSAVFTAIVLLVSVTVHALDLHYDGAVCQADLKAYPELKTLVTPSWAKHAHDPLTVGRYREIQATNSRLREAMSGHLNDLNEIAHDLNARYLANIHDSLYLRLAAASEVGIDLGKYGPGLSALQQRCSAADLSLHSMKKEVAPLASLAAEIAQDHRAFDLRTEGAEISLRRFAVAALESARLERVLKHLTKQSKSADVARSLAENERRLIRLHFMFPSLGDLETAAVATHISLAMREDAIGIRADATNFETHPRVEELLQLAPVGVKGAVLGPVPGAPKVSPDLADFNTQLYDRIMSGDQALPSYIRRELLQGIDVAVATAIESASLKCANATPCSAFSVNPELAGAFIEEVGRVNSLGPLACACEIGKQRETVPGRINLGLGIASATAVVAALVQPEVAFLVRAAIVLSVADMGAAATGIYDGYDSMTRTNRDVLARSGGATGEREREQSQAEDTRAMFNMIYDFGTGVIGLLPPAKITTAYSAVPFRQIIREGQFLKDSGLEFMKGATGAALPDLVSEKYSDIWDARRLVVLLPPAARAKYPRLWANFQMTAGLGRYAVAVAVRDAVLEDLKQAAWRTSSAQLARGEVSAAFVQLPETRALPFVR